MRLSKSILLTAAACLLPIASHAAPVSSNPSLSVDGLQFGGFTCSISKGGIFATPSHCDQINVNTITSPGNGIQISSGFFAAPLSFDDAVIDYHVSSSAGIQDVGLDFNGSFLGLGVSSVTESVFSGSNLVGYATVSCAPGACGMSDLSDNIALNGTYNNLYIQKDINVTGVVGFAETSIIDQTFTTTDSAPEPSSFALFGSGLIGAASLLRRRAKLGNWGRGSNTAA